MKNLQSKITKFLQLTIFKLGIILLFSGCAQLDRYERTYTVDYSKESARMSMTLKPIKGYAK